MILLTNILFKKKQVVGEGYRTRSSSYVLLLVVGSRYAGAEHPAALFAACQWYSQYSKAAVVRDILVCLCGGGVISKL
jgi:hypothetical protein